MEQLQLFPISPISLCCSKCGIVKTISEFRRSRRGRLGVRCDCKRCCADYKRKICSDPNWKKKNNEYNKQKRATNPEWRIEKNRKSLLHIKSNPNLMAKKKERDRRRRSDPIQKQRRNEQDRQKRATDLEYRKKQNDYQRKIREREDKKRQRAEYLKNRNLTNPEAAKNHNQRTCEYNKKRLKEDINFRLMFYLRNRIKSRLTSKKSITKIIKEIGYTPAQLWRHLETLFPVGMSLENYGQKHDEKHWHIDHIFPCSKFPLETPASIIYSLDNLKPMWAIENLKKNAAIISIPPSVTAYLSDYELQSSITNTLTEKDKKLFKNPIVWAAIDEYRKTLQNR